jgi:outer membrane protein OmpA-like peptidoglycan-associated protein
MGSRFGYDFSRVRVHTDSAAGEAARSVSAQAFTVGSDIGFSEDRYQPQSTVGRQLLAHELAHVVQQSGVSAAGPQQRAGLAADPEARADAAANRVLGGGSVDAASLGSAPVGLQRKPDEPTTEAAPTEEVDIITGAGGGAPAADPTTTVLDHFVRDKATLTKKQKAAIEQLAFSMWLHLSLHADAKAAVIISGHTDTTGSEKHNSGLSGDRAESARAALAAALKKQDVDLSKISIGTNSHGESRLRVPTADGVDEPRNRRVEIEVTIEVKAPPPSPDAGPGEQPPLPGTPGSPRLWEMPGFLDEPGETSPPVGPRAPKSEGEWLEEALKRDPLLKSLPKWARDKAIGALKDADEKAADAIIDAIPFDDKYKKAAKAAMKALLQTLKGRKYKPPPERPPSLPDIPPMRFPKAPGEMIFKLPAIRF